MATPVHQAAPESRFNLSPTGTRLALALSWVFVILAVFLTLTVAYSVMSGEHVLDQLLDHELNTFIAVMIFIYAGIMNVFAIDRRRALVLSLGLIILAAVSFWLPTRAAHIWLLGVSGLIGVRGLINGRRILSREGLFWVLTAALLLVILSGALVDAAERDQPHGTIKNVGDGIWWAAATVSTIGYGDVAPVTAEGRLIGFVLMFVGVTVFGLALASLSQVIATQTGLQRDLDRREQINERSTGDRLTAIEQQLAEINKSLQQRADPPA